MQKKGQNRAYRHNLHDSPQLRNRQLTQQSRSALSRQQQYRHSQGTRNCAIQESPFQLA
jgi:hypothetical protein